MVASTVGRLRLPLERLQDSRVKVLLAEVNSQVSNRVRHLAIRLVHPLRLRQVPHPLVGRRLLLRLGVKQRLLRRHLAVPPLLIKPLVVPRQRRLYLEGVYPRRLLLLETA
jgi:hypothetical protein